VDLGLKDRVAIVAASSAGLGKAVALGLGREGVKLALCARTEATLAGTAGEIRREAGVEVLAQPVDVTVESQVHKFVQATLAQFGRVDIVVANAGGPPSKPFAATTVEDWQHALQLNFMSTLYFARETLPVMQKRKWGRFIAITSVTVRQPVEGLVLSNAVRQSVAGLVKTLSNEYGSDNVLVNNVCPGFTRTARLDHLSARLAASEGVAPAEIHRRWSSQIPLQRLGTPEEFANLVVFLASECASYITGASIAVDGGFVKGVL
jgi:3-oxoacyl-[acyl-carrier protein] reductase